MCGLALGPTQPPIQWITGVLSLEVKWLGDEADLHTVPSFKKESIYIFILPAHLLGINSNNLYLSLMFWSEREFTFSRAHISLCVLKYEISVHNKFASI